MADPIAEESVDPRKRTLGWVIWAGILLGGLWGYFRYGVFSLLTVALAGVGMIVTVGLYAAWIAIRPASDANT